MDKTHSLQALLNNTATEDDVALLKRLLASGEISIGGNVNQSVIIIGSGNTVELPPAALDRLNARPMLGNLDRDLTGEEIAPGLRRLDKLLPNRAPVLLPHYKEQVGRLRPTLKTEVKALSEFARRERLEALAAINSICIEALDVSFNGICLGEEAPKYDARSPFRGLESFRPEDSEFFFGREALTQKLVGKIKAHSFLAVLGASGSGKSSLVMAGVIPVLDLDYVIFRPGTKPLDELESARGKSLIVVDQFEELFTLTRDESTRKDFIARLLDESTRARIILTLRSDFLGEVGAYRTLSAEIQSHLEIIPPMDMDELRRAMEGQAGVVGLRFEADLSQQILDDVAGEPGAMPLLQHALWELWNRRHGRNLRASEYRAFGGVKQAITSTAENVYADCSKPEQDALRDIFLRLTRLDEGDEGRDTRRRVPLDVLIPSGRDAASITLLLDKLANARLIVKTVNEDKTEVEVAHEALIRHWERLRIWLNEDRDALHLRESVSESAKEWERSGKHESLLNSRWVKLDEALLLAQDSRYRLTEIEQAYLKGCVGLRNKEQRERERRRKITIASALAVTVTTMVILVGWSISSTRSAKANATQVSVANTAQANAEIEKQNADEQAKIALARQLATEAQSIFSENNSKQQIAALLAIQSMRLFPLSGASQILQNHVLVLPTASEIHDGPVNSVVFSPNSRYVASGSDDGSIRIWETVTGNEIVRINHGSRVRSAIFSSDGKYIASIGCDREDINRKCTFGSARVWRANTGDEVTRVTHGEERIVTAILFSADGKRVVTGGNDGTVRVWNLSDGKELVRMKHDDAILSISFSPNEKFIASGSADRTARIWDAATGAEIYRFETNEDVADTVFSPDGRYLITRADITAVIKVWDLSLGKEINQLIHDNIVTSVAFSPDSKYILSGSFDKTLRVWDVTSGNETHRFSHEGEVYTVAISPDGAYVASGECISRFKYEAVCINGAVHIWNLSTRAEISRGTLDGYVGSISFSPDGAYVVSGGSSNTASVWRVNTQSRNTRLFHDGTIQSLKFSPNSVFLASGNWGGVVQVWEADTGVETSRINSGRNDIIIDNIAFSPDNQFLVSSGDVIARVWSFKDRLEISLVQHGNRISYVDISPDGRYVASGSASVFYNNDGTLKVWELRSGREIIHMETHSSITSLDFDPNGQYVVTGNGDDTISVWNVSTGKEITKMTHDDDVVSVSFSPNGKYIVSASGDHTARVWNAFTGQEIARTTHGGYVTCASFSPNSDYIVSGSVDNTARVWNMNTGDEISRMTHDDDVTSVSFSPDGNFISSGSYDKSARVWDANTGREITRMTYDSVVSSVTFSPNGKYVAAGGDDSFADIWMYQPEDIIENSCLLINRNLTRSEWARYIGDALPYQAVCPNLPIEPESTP